MLVYIAKGDSYGVGFEFTKEIYIEKHHKLEKYLPHKFDSLKAGDYSDDTQMSIAIAELMISDKDFDIYTLAEAFLRVYKRDSIDGYAKGFQKFLDECKSTEDFINNIINTSNRNGAAMRAVPLGYIKDENELLTKAHSNAVLTHNTEEGIFSSKAVALLSNYFIYNKGSKKKIKEYIYKKLDTITNDSKNSRCKCEGFDTIDAVITILKHSETLTEVLDKSIKMGGDTDSVAAIALGIASTSKQYKDDLPEFLERDLRNDKYGKDFLYDLTKKLEAKYL